MKYSITTLVAGLVSLAALSANGFFSASAEIVKYKLLADAISVPGMILILLPVLIWISGEGVFDGLTYALSILGRSLTFRGLKKQEKFYDYKMRKAENRMSGYWFMLLVGVGFVLVSSIFLVLFYTNGGSDAYKAAIGR